MAAKIFGEFDIDKVIKNELADKEFDVECPKCKTEPPPPLKIFYHAGGIFSFFPPRLRKFREYFLEFL